MKKLVSFEGIDGSGKTTQARILARELSERGHRAVFVGSRGNSRLADRIKTVVQDEELGVVHPGVELLLYSASYLERTIKSIIPELRREKTVVVYRYLDGNYVYRRYGRGMDTEEIEKICGFASQGLFPDITFLLDVPAETAYDRIVRGRDRLDRVEKEGVDLLGKVRTGYLGRARANNARWVIIDGNRPQEDVSRSIWQEFEDRI